MPLEPLNADQLESIHRASMIILEQTGIEVNSLRARQFYKNAGAEVDEASQIVRLPQDLVISLLETAPSEFILTPTNSERALNIGKNNIHFDFWVILLKANMKINLAFNGWKVNIYAKAIFVWSLLLL